MGNDTRDVEREGGLGPDIQGDGQSSGIPAAGRHEGMSYSPTGGPGLRHWSEARISEPGLDDRGDVFFAAVEMTRMPMILTDPNLPDNPIVFANRAFEDLTGYTQEEIVGRNCRFLQGTQTDRERIGELRDAVAAERAVAVEVLNYKRDGTPFWNAVYVAPVYEKNGRLLYFFASQLDVTRRRMSEQAFRQAQKMESIGQLTAGLAHDFNNLLQVVAGNLELLDERLQDETLRRYLTTARAATDRGARLTRQLLAFARKTRLEPKPIDLNTLVNDFGAMLETTVGPSVDLQFMLRRRLPQTLLDPVHLEMALINVLINARDAMPNGGTITVATGLRTLNGDAEAHHLAPGDYVVLSVVDEGTGMPPYVLERATEPFFTTKASGRGTGLGLAMVHGFVQQSLGKLEIESAPDRGTTIRMLFPVANERALPAVPAPAKNPVELRGNAETILVVEDSEDVLTLAREHLDALGYGVLEARNAEEALRILDAHDGRIDLLFTDLIMPGSMGGIALAERVSEMLPDVPILLTTGYNEDLLAEGPRAPTMDVLGKPYRRTELADRVRAALNRRARPRPVRTERAAEGPAHEG